jgi:hypothetical protein
MKEYRGVDFIKLEFNDNAVYGGIDPSFLWNKFIFNSI